MMLRMYVFTLCLFIVIPNDIFSQSTRKVLYEEFTSENDYQWVPGDQLLNTLLLNNFNSIIPIKWPIDLPVAPSPTWSLYQSNKAEFNWRYRSSTGSTLAAIPSTLGYGYPSQNTATNTPVNGINTIPTGRLDGQHQWNFGAITDHPSSLNTNVILAAQSVTTNFRIAMTPSWNPNFTSAVVQVSITSINSFTSIGAFMFRLCLIEREIHFTSPPGNNGQMHFYNMVRKCYPTTVVNNSVTQIGTTLPSIWSPSQTFTFNINCNIPAYIKNLSEMAFVGFIQDDGDRQIHQSERTLPPSIPNDLSVVSVIIPVNCNAVFTPSLCINNLGPVSVNAFTATPFIDGIPQPAYIYTSALAANATATITLPSYTANYGSHVFSISISNVNGTDINMSNNSGKTVFGISSMLTSSLISQKFSSFPPSLWYVLNYDQSPPSWGYSSVGGYSTTGGSAKYDFYNNLNIGDVDDLFFPALDLTGVFNPTLSFDLAYAQIINENDKLELKISNDCGATWTTLFSKQGSALATAPSNSVSAFVPNTSQWRTETLNLSNYSNSPSVLIKFTATCDYGNNLYIDNVNIIDQNVINSISEKANVFIYPLPASDIIHIMGAQDKNIEIYNTLGMRVLYCELDNTNKINVNGLTNGVYFLKANERITKIVIDKK